MTNLMESSGEVVVEESVSPKSKLKIAKLVLPSLILAVCAACLQLLSMVILSLASCRLFKDLGYLYKIFWLTGLAFIFGVFLVPSIIITALIYSRQRRDIHFNGKFQVICCC